MVPLLLPIVLIPFNFTVLLHEQNPANSLQYTLNAINLAIGALQIISGVILVRGVLRIRNYLKNN